MTTEKKNCGVPSFLSVTCNGSPEVFNHKSKPSQQPLEQRQKSIKHNRLMSKRSISPPKPSPEQSIKNKQSPEEIYTKIFENVAVKTEQNRFIAETDSSNQSNKEEIAVSKVSDVGHQDEKCCKATKEFINASNNMIEETNIKRANGNIENTITPCHTKYETLLDTNLKCEHTKEGSSGLQMSTGIKYTSCSKTEENLDNSSHLKNRKAEFQLENISKLGDGEIWRTGNNELAMHKTNGEMSPVTIKTNEGIEGMSHGMRNSNEGIQDLPCVMTKCRKDISTAIKTNSGVEKDALMPRDVEEISPVKTKNNKGMEVISSVVATTNGGLEEIPHVSAKTSRGIKDMPPMTIINNKKIEPRMIAETTEEMSDVTPVSSIGIQEMSRMTISTNKRIESPLITTAAEETDEMTPAITTSNRGIEEMFTKTNNEINAIEETPPSRKNKFRPLGTAEISNKENLESNSRNLRDSRNEIQELYTQFQNNSTSEDMDMISEETFKLNGSNFTSELGYQRLSSENSTKPQSCEEIVGFVSAEAGFKMFKIEDPANQDLETSCINKEIFKTKHEATSCANKEEYLEGIVSNGLAKVDSATANIDEVDATFNLSPTVGESANLETVGKFSLNEDFHFNDVSDEGLCYHQDNLRLNVQESSNAGSSDATKGEPKKIRLIWALMEEEHDRAASLNKEIREEVKITDTEDCYHTKKITDIRINNCKNETQTKEREHEETQASIENANLTPEGTKTETINSIDEEMTMTGAPDSCRMREITDITINNCKNGKQTKGCEHEETQNLPSKGPFTTEDDSNSIDVTDFCLVKHIDSKSNCYAKSSDLEKVENESTPLKEETECVKKTNSSDFTDDCRVIHNPESYEAKFTSKNPAEFSCEGTNMFQNNVSEPCPRRKSRLTLTLKNFTSNQNINQNSLSINSQDDSAVNSTAVNSIKDDLKTIAKYNKQITPNRQLFEENLLDETAVAITSSLNDNQRNTQIHSLENNNKYSTTICENASEVDKSLDCLDHSARISNQSYDVNKNKINFLKHAEELNLQEQVEEITDLSIKPEEIKIITENLELHALNTLSPECYYGDINFETCSIIEPFRNKENDEDLATFALYIQGPEISEMKTLQKSLLQPLEFGQCKEDSCKEIPEFRSKTKTLELQPTELGLADAESETESLCVESRVFCTEKDSLCVEVDERRVRRCSSLKTGKTPPGTPGRKKIVRFADVLGLDLADVRTFLDEIPKIPSSAYNDLTAETDFPTYCNQSLKNQRVLLGMFRQPGGQSNFLEKVTITQVMLENAVVEDPISFSIRGLVRVRNLDFDKQVHVRYSLDSWKTFSDLQAVYVENSCDGFTDKFTFLLYAYSLSIGQKIEFAIRFQSKGAQFWDNNGGTNYCFQCLPASNPTTYSPISSGVDDQIATFYYMEATTTQIQDLKQNEQLTNTAVQEYIMKSLKNNKLQTNQISKGELYTILLVLFISIIFLYIKMH